MNEEEIVKMLEATVKMQKLLFVQMADVETTVRLRLFASKANERLIGFQRELYKVQDEIVLLADLVKQEEPSVDNSSEEKVL
jgi:hypothetical protein